MNYEEAVEKEIKGNQDEIKRRKKQWKKIAGSFEQGGEDAISTVLINESDSITNEFEKLLSIIEETL